MPTINQYCIDAAVLLLKMAEINKRIKTRLVGKGLARRSCSPRSKSGDFNPLVCAALRYKISDYIADMIFHGAFREMQSSNTAADPGKIAASLGLAGSCIKTLETRCEK